jgi:hypothetical protein
LIGAKEFVETRKLDIDGGWRDKKLKYLKAWTFFDQKIKIKRKLQNLNFFSWIYFRIFIQIFLNFLVWVKDIKNLIFFIVFMKIF